MAEPVSKTKGGDVFEDFPLPERKHFGANHRAAQGSLGAGLNPTAEEPLPFAHIRRDYGPAPGNAHAQAEERSSASRPASGVVFASPGASAWKSSYQAMADGSDGVGQVKKVSRRKRSVQQESQSAVRPAYFGASMAPRVYFGREQENASPQGSKGYMPGYTGHAAKTRTQSIEVSQHHNSVDKSLLLENYRHNVPGYSGFYK